MHSIAMSFTLEEKPILYFSKAYLNVGDCFLDKLQETGIFYKVVGITGRGELFDFIQAIRKTKDYTDEQIAEVGTSIFDKYLEPYYAKLFEDADFNDDIYVYNDFQWHYYYIAKHFEHIIGIEDGYCSIVQQLDVHKYKGDHERVIPFVKQGLYPEPLYKYEKVEKIYSSVWFDDIDDYYKDKIEVLNFNDLIESNSVLFRNALLEIFDLSDYHYDENCTLILLQPLHRAMYCSALDEYLLYKKYIEHELKEGHKVFVKPHPADKFDDTIYENERVVVLPKDFPIEVFNYNTNIFGKVVTFGSTGADTLSCSKAYHSYYTSQDKNVDKIRSFIKKEIKGLKIRIDMFVKVSELTVDTYFNVMSCVFTSGLINSHIHVVVPKHMYNEAVEFFDTTLLQQKLFEYEKKYEGDKQYVTWLRDMKELDSYIKKRKPAFLFHATDDLEDYTVVNNIVLKNYDANTDYVMLVEEQNACFRLTRRIRRYMESFVTKGQIFQRITPAEFYYKTKYVTLNPGFINEVYKGYFTNALWHRTIIDDVAKTGYTESTFFEILNSEKHKYVISRRFSDRMIVPNNPYMIIEDGKEYFMVKIESLIRERDEDDNLFHYKIAMVLYDYFDWRIVKLKSYGSLPFMAIIDEIDMGSEDKLEVCKLLSSSVMYEKYMNGNYDTVQNLDYYRNISKYIEKASIDGTFERMIDSEIQNKVKSKSENKKRIRNILKWK